MNDNDKKINNSDCTIIKACNTPSTSFLFDVLHHIFFRINFLHFFPMLFGINCTAEDKHPGFHAAITSALQMKFGCIQP